MVRRSAGDPWAARPPLPAQPRAADPGRKQRSQTNRPYPAAAPSRAPPRGCAPRARGTRRSERPLTWGKVPSPAGHRSRPPAAWGHLLAGRGSEGLQGTWGGSGGAPEPSPAAAPPPGCLRGRLAGCCRIRLGLLVCGAKPLLPLRIPEQRE